ncbi:MAG: stage III sporulation protein AE [Clostridia bacterium]|nr:stage III sporulation protein AE [Clostridia bacterium]
MKRIAVILIILIIFPTMTFAYEIPDIDGYDMFSETAKSLSTGKFSLNPVEVFNNVIKSLTSEVKAFSVTAAAILVMTLLSSTMGTLNSALGDRASSNAAFFTFFTVISGLALSCFSKALGYGIEVISYMTDFMSKLTPIIIITLFACCKSASAAAFEPVLSSAVLIVSEIINRCLVPLISFSAVLSVAGNVGDKNSISGFVRIVKSSTKWIMALVITVFTGINAIYGFASPALDAVGAKTLKFAVGSLVPVVGGFLSDTLDTVAASGAVVKNAVGASGIVMICIICITPIIKLAIMQIMFKLISAITEPITDKRISQMLWDMSEAIVAVFGVVVLTAVMFTINICIILRFTA